MSRPDSTAPSATVDTGRLGDVLARLNRQVRRSIVLPLGASALQTLATLNDGGAMRLGDLARSEGVTPATLSRIVATLEEEGCARRTTDESDRRAAFLEITPAGRRLLAGVRRDRARVLDDRAAALHRDQLVALAAALEALEALADG